VCTTFPAEGRIHPSPEQRPQEWQHGERLKPDARTADAVPMHTTDALDAGYDDEVISQVIRPAAIVPEEAASAILVELSLNSATSGGLWLGEPSRWRRYDTPWAGVGDPGASELVGSIQVAYGTPTKYEITIYRVTITRFGHEQGWTVESLCDEALGFGDLSLAQCPRAQLTAPPQPFRF
jgi:hypothetical protein